MNILQTEDLIKGLPDERLLQEAQSPSGEVPLFLVVSEIQRRTDMRKRFKNQAETPKDTVSEQIIDEGIRSIPPRVPPQGPPNMPYPLPQGQGLIPSDQHFPPPRNPNEAILPPGNGGFPNGIRRFQDGGLIGPQSFTFPYEGQNYELNTSGYPSKEAAIDAFIQGTNAPLSITQGQPGITDIQLNPVDQAVQAASTQSTIGQRFSNIGEQVSGNIEPVKFAFNKLRNVLQGTNRFETFPVRPKPETGGIAALDVVPPPIRSPFSIPTDTAASTRAEYDALGQLVAPSEKPDKAAQLDTAEGGIVQGKKAVSKDDFISRLGDLIDREQQPVPDISDLVEQQRNAAYANALMQIGSGIAGNDLAGGLSRAGAAVNKDMAAARQLELKGRMAGYEAQQGELDRDINILSKAGTLDLSKARSLVDQAIQKGRNDNERMRFAQAMILSIADSTYTTDAVDREKLIVGLINRLLPADMVKKLLNEEPPPADDTSGFSVVKKG